MTKTELLKIAKPTLFNTDMVRAIQDGRKTVTRRVVKPSNKRYFIDKTLSGKPAEFQMISIDEAKFIRMAKPQYKVNDILYVRETARIQSMKNFEKSVKLLFKADENLQEFNVSDVAYEKLSGYSQNKWLSPYYLAKDTARIFLKVTDVRVERLQDITIPQAKDEGVTCDCLDNKENVCYKGNVGHFQGLWNSTIKKQDIDKYGWNANPWVWVYEFERVECDERN